MRPFILILVLITLVSCTLTSVSEPTPIPPPPTIRPQTGFGAQQVATPVPTVPAPVFSTAVVITMTPIGLNDPITTPVDTDLPDPQPGEQTENIVEALINRLLIPVWNFLYTFITGSIISLWDFAGLRGGMMAQFIFCLIPGIVVTIGVLYRVFRWRR